jgi:hypothetical protein
VQLGDTARFFFLATLKPKFSTLVQLVLRRPLRAGSESATQIQHIGAISACIVRDLCKPQGAQIQHIGAISALPCYIEGVGVETKPKNSQRTASASLLH